MERAVEHYKKYVKQLLSEYESLDTEHSQIELLFDDIHQRYMAIRVGWMNRKRVHLCLIHIDICEDTIVIQCNNTEDLIVTELEAMGIPRQQICLGFLPPEVRALANSYEREDILEPV